MEKFGFVYLWFDRKHKRYYVGSHWGTEDDGYVCSSKWMRTSYKKRPQDFKRRILSRVYTNREDLINEEQRWLNMIKPSEIAGRNGHGKPSTSRYYNLQLVVGDQDYSKRKPRPKASKEELLRRKKERRALERKSSEERRESWRQNAMKYWNNADPQEHSRKIKAGRKPTSSESRERYRQAALKREAAKRAMP